MIQFTMTPQGLGIGFDSHMDTIRALTAFQGLNCIYNMDMKLTRVATQGRCLQVLEEVFGVKVSCRKARKMWPAKSLGSFDNWCLWWVEAVGLVEVVAAA